MGIRALLLLTVLALTLAVLPAQPTAAQSGLPLPPIQQPDSGRFEGYYAIDDVPLAVSQGIFAQEERSYTTGELLTRTMPLPEDAAPPAGVTTQDTVIYDGAGYVRYDNEARWYQTRNPGLLSPILINDVTEIINFLGELGNGEQTAETSVTGHEEIGGIPTTRFLIVFTNRDVEDGEVVFETQVLLELWVGLADNHLHQFRINLPVDGDDPSLGRLAVVFRYYDFNNPDITVTPPLGARPIANRDEG